MLAPELLQVIADHGEVRVIGRRLHEQVVGPTEQRLRDVEAERRLQREEAVGFGGQHVRRHHRADAAAPVLHQAHAVEVLGLDHKRRVRRVEDLVLRREALVDEPQEVALCARVQLQRRLVEKDHDSVLLLLELVEGREKREEPAEA